MTATSFLELKQSLTRVSETERRELSAFLIRRGQERPAWKKETARRLADMAAGQQVSVAALRSRLNHG
jgi:phage-related protein